MVHHEQVDLPGSLVLPTDEMLAKVFPRAGFSLQTWGRTQALEGGVKLACDPHWIAVRGGTTLHLDPKYPRYSHHLKVRVDPDIICRGMDKTELKLVRGTFYILDAGSPHQVVCRGPGKWNVAVSVDSDIVLNPREVIRACKLYALTTPFLVGYE